MKFIKEILENIRITKTDGHNFPESNASPKEGSKPAKVYTASQEKVIQLNQGYNMVLAGPGCGKTDVLAERVANAYENYGLVLTDALCLTFTNRAARGMFKRISSRLGDNYTDLFVGNIHRYCSQFLFNNEVLPQETIIVDEIEIQDIVLSVIGDDLISDLIGLRRDNSDFYSINWRNLHRIFGLVNEHRTPSGYIKKKRANKIIANVRLAIVKMSHLMQQIVGDHPEEDLMWANLWRDSDIYVEYPTYHAFQTLCRKILSGEAAPTNPILSYLNAAAQFIKYKENNCLIDFDDLLIKTYDAYRFDTERKYKRYSWVQIDEVQDLSNFQISLVDYLTDTTKDFVTVYFGDEQQAIYSFMGASLSTLDFLKQRCGTIIRLDKNFRSPKYLLDLFNDYAIRELKVSADLLPEPKDDKTAKRHDICFHVYETEETEMQKVKESITPFLLNSQKGKERTAILVPWNNDASEISQTLERDGISHFRISGMDTFQTVSMRLLISHLNVISNEFNMVSWARILQTTYAVDTMRDGYHLVEKMRSIAMTPCDLLRDDRNTYITDFCKTYDHQEIIVFDTETTGLDIVHNDIVQIAAIKVRNGQVSSQIFNIFLNTDQTIPQKLGSLDNPMIKEYKSALSSGRVLPRKEGFAKFLEWAGNRPLIGHNVNYDINILRYNLQRVGLTFNGESLKIFDTLKLSRLLFPRLISYKLKDLIKYLNLEGNNSHMADDDIMATVELLKVCRQRCSQFIGEQLSFLQTDDAKKAIEELNIQYKACFNHSLGALFEFSRSATPILVSEMKYAYDTLTANCEVKRTKYFDNYVLKFIEQDVIEPKEVNLLYSQLSNHIMDIGTYREADLCDSTVMTDKLFVSTIHKAKGLEFENVVVMKVNEGRFPKFYSNTSEAKDEDRRLLYVAMSRAMQRLILTASGSFGGTITSFVEKIIDHFCIRFYCYFLNSYIFFDLHRDSLKVTINNGSGQITYIYPDLYKTGKTLFQIKKEIDRLPIRSSDVKECLDALFAPYQIHSQIATVK